jgi:tetratricopeptide (TPR) repeat protein
MNRDGILFSLVGLGFGLFLGFLFASWANQRSAATRPPQGNPAEQSSITVADRTTLQTRAEETARRARANPSDFDAQMEAAQAAFQAERNDDSIEFLLKANELQPDNLEPVIALGHVNAEAENFSAAEKWYAAALVKSPDNVDVRTNLGVVLMLRRPPDFERAVKEFGRVLERDARNETALQHLAYAHSQRGDAAAARAALERLQQANPSNPEVERLRREIDARAAATPAAKADGGAKR